MLFNRVLPSTKPKNPGRRRTARFPVDFSVAHRWWWRDGDGAATTAWGRDLLRARRRAYMLYNAIAPSSPSSARAFSHRSAIHCIYVYTIIEPWRIFAVGKHFREPFSRARPLHRLPLKPTANDPTAPSLPPTPSPRTANAYTDVLSRRNNWIFDLYGGPLSPVPLRRLVYC